jgi:hypothetical protein
MTSDTWFGRLRTVDVRVLAAIAAALLLIVGVMWVVPTTPDSNSFKFESARRTIADARPIELGNEIRGSINDASDSDFYRITVPRNSSVDVRMMSGSAKMIPGMRIFDSSKQVIADKAPDFQRRPGANIEFSFSAQSNMTYYLEVFTQRNTNGPYTLIVNLPEP